MGRSRKKAPKLFAVVDPAAPAALQKFITTEAERGTLYRPTEQEQQSVIVLPAKVLPVVAATGLAGAALAVVVHSISDSLHWLVWTGGVIAILIAVAIFVPRGLWELEDASAPRRQLRDALPYMVLSDDLTPTAAALLARAKQAADQVTGTRVHADDLIDRQRNQVELPAQVWDIAQALAAYSRFVDQTPTGAVTPLLREAADERATQLGTARKGVERRIVALEHYAAAAVQADRSYTEWLQVQELSHQEPDVRALLAATAADDLAVAELEAMTADAGIVGEALRTAVGEARTAALQVLPPADVA